MASTESSNVTVRPQVIFRRVRGRIVPIRASENKSKQRLALSGAGHVAAGVGVAVGTGFGVAKLVKHSGVMKMKANMLFRVKRKVIKSLLKTGRLAEGGTGLGEALHASARMTEAARMRQFSTMLRSARSPLLAGGAILSGALLGAGALRLNRALVGRKKGDMQTVGSSAAISAGAAGLTAAAYYHFLPVGSFSKVAANTFARMKGLPRPHVASWWKGGL